MKKILVLGMYENAMYHPMNQIDGYLKELMPQMEVEATDDIQKLTRPEAYEAVVSYWDDWEHPIPADCAEALEQYVKEGGKLLLLHNGISLQLSEQLEQMIGGRFLTHPEQELLTFIPQGGGWTEGCERFELVEEPYRFELRKDNKKIVLSYLHKGEEYPGGWGKAYGRGYLIYLAPGHTPEKFYHPGYTKLLQAAVKELLQRETRLRNGEAVSGCESRA